jgi:diguanylate cyclase (GGDEF)-like protein
LGQDKFKSNGESVTITISVGVATFPEHGKDAESLINSADAALYEAKEKGRNRVVLADAEVGKQQKVPKKSQTQGS